MSDKTVKVRLEAVTSQYVTAMQRAGQSTGQFASTVTGNVGKAARSLQGVQTEATIAGGALLGLGIAAVATSTSFDKQMSNVKAATKASADQLDQLRASAIKAGADTVFSATEAAQGQEALAKAGLSTAAILSGGLRGSLDLAAAGEIAVADAAEVAATALTVFGLKGSDVGHVADLLAAGAGKAQGGVDDLSAALNQSALVAKQTGLSVDDTVGALSEFASAGLLGSDAGTSFKTMLQRLTPQSQQAADLMSQLGINAYDASGKFVGLEAYAGKLRGALVGLTAEQRNAALATLFGSDAVRAAAVLYDGGAEGVRKWRNAVNDAGYAADQAAERNNNLAGDLQALQGSIESALIKSGSEANGVLRSLTHTATDAVNAFGGLPGPVLGIGTAAVTMGGAFLLAAPRIVATKDALSTLGVTGTRTSAIMGTLAKGIGTVATAGAIAAVATQPMRDELDKLVPSVTAIEGVMKQYADGSARWFTDATFEGANAVSAFGDALDYSFGNRNLDNLLNAVTFGVVDDPRLAADGKLIDNIDQAAARLVASGNLKAARDNVSGLTAALFKQRGITSEQVLSLMPNYRDALLEVANGTGTATGAANGLAGGLNQVDAAAKTAEDAMKSLEDALNALGGRYADADTATANLRRTLTESAAAIAENGKSVNANRSLLNLNTKAGQDNQAALKAIRDQLFDSVPAWAAAGVSADTVRGYTEDARDAFVAAAEKAGLSATAAEKLATKYGLIPENVETYVKAFGVGQAQTALDSLLTKLHTIDGYRAVFGVATINPDTAERRLGGTTSPPTIHPATGGWVTTNGLALTHPWHPVGTDTVPAMLTPGEAVINRAAARRNAPFIDAMNAGTLAYAPAMAPAAASTVTHTTTFDVGGINVTPAQGERAEESLPRALHRAAFELGFGG